MKIPHSNLPNFILIAYLRTILAFQSNNSIDLPVNRGKPMKESCIFIKKNGSLKIYQFFKINRLDFIQRN